MTASLCLLRLVGAGEAHHVGIKISCKIALVLLISDALAIII
jgi:hypothetical protein